MKLLSFELSEERDDKSTGHFYGEAEIGFKHCLATWLSAIALSWPRRSPGESVVD